MKQMKKLFALLLALVLVSGCAAQAPSEEPEATAPPTTIPAATEPATRPTEPPTQAPTEPEPFVAEVHPVTTGEQKQVTVKTANEFLAAIGPDTEIIVDAQLIDLSKASGYGKDSKTYYAWRDEFDGPELLITGVSNLTIRGAGEDRTAVVISAAPRYADVLTFENCSSITVSGLTAGHAQEPGACIGGVLCFENSQDILVENCGLFGCGTLGVVAYSSKNMQIVNNEIYECSVGGVEFTNCDAVNVDGNTFRDLGGPIFRIYDCGTITCNGEDAKPFR